MTSKAQGLDAELLRYWELYPVVAHVSKCRCPVHRQTWIFVDEIAKTAVCHQCDHTYTLAELIAWKEAHPGVPRKSRIECPACRRRVHPRNGLVACACGWEGTVQDIEDHEARRLMEEAPNGATIYHKPRHR